MKYATGGALAAIIIGSRALAQTPAGAEKPLTATDIMQKTLAAYSAAKTYQASWSYVLEQGDGPTHQLQKMILEIKSKSPTKLLFTVAPAPGQKPVPGGQALPELRVVVDGKTAYFENTTEKSYYKVTLPKNAAISPLMFLPIIPSISGVERKEDITTDGKTLYLLAANTTDGGIGRMEIETGTFHIKRMATEALLGLSKSTSTMTVDKETYDADIPDSTFSYKAAKGAKEMEAPPTAAVMFGPPDKK
jgi:outer membrane lipoprotein-sorting protein